MVKLNVEGDWSPRLKNVDLLVQNSSLSYQLVRDCIESPLLGIRVHYQNGATRRGLIDCLSGRGATAPMLVLNLGNYTASKKKWKPSVDGVIDASAGDRYYMGDGLIQPEPIESISRLEGRVVLALGAGWGDPGMARGFIRAGAVAYLGSVETGPVSVADQMLFVGRFFDEIEWRGATVKEAWERSAIQNPITGKFRLYKPGRKSGTRSARLISFPAPVRPPELARIFARDRALGPAGEWRPAPHALDILTIPGFSAGDGLAERQMGESWGLDVRLHPCRTPHELRRRLAGDGLTAPIVILKSHGCGSKEPAIIAGANTDRSKRVLFGPDAIRRMSRLRGRLIIATGCGLGCPAMAEAFLASGARAYIGGGWQGLSHGFLVRFLHELAVHRVSLSQALARSRSLDEASLGVRLFSGKSRESTSASRRSDRPVVPGHIEGFEGETDNEWYGNWEAEIYEYPQSYATAAPGGRPGLAFQLMFDFAGKKDPSMTLHLSKDRQSWANASVLAMDVYVPRDLPFSRPLELAVEVSGSKYSWRMEGLRLRRSWQTLRLPLDSRDWRVKGAGETAWHRGSIDAAGLGTVTCIQVHIPGQGRREAGAVYLDNLRLEKNGGRM